MKNTFFNSSVLSLSFFLPFFLSISLSQHASAQAFQLNGIVVDSSNGKPLEFVTTALFVKKNTKPIQVGYTTDKGKFEFLALPRDTYRLELVYAGFRSVVLQNIDIQSNKQLEKIEMSIASKLLQELTITAQKPLIEMQGDKLVYNAENDVAAQGGNAIELLRKIPFITVDQDDNIELKGQTNFRVQLNGRNTGMFAKNPKDALRGMPATLIKKIEIITNPGAKYDADGTSGIINVITDKKVGGYNGNVSTSYNTLNQTYNNFNINVKQGKLGISSYAGGGTNRNASHSSFYRTNNVASTFYKQEQLGTGTFKSGHIYSNIELAYDFDTLHTLSMYGSYNSGLYQSSNQQDFLIYNWQNQIQSNAARNVSYRNTWPNLGVGLDYIQKFKKPDQEWTVSINQTHSFGQNISNNNFDYLFGGEDRILRNSTKNNEKELTIQTDFDLPIVKDAQTLSFGAKNIRRHILADYVQEVKDTVGDLYNINQNNTNLFDYQQNVYSSYLSYSLKTKKKWTITPGFRYEYTEINGKLREGGTPFQNTYPSYIPTFSLNYAPKIGQSYRFSYSRRLQRPSLWYMNPYVLNEDPRNISYGNPYLNPEFTHSLELGISRFKGGKNLSFTLQYGNTLDVINNLTTINSATGVTTSSYQNLGTTQRLALIFSISGDWKQKFQYSANGTIAHFDMRGSSGTTPYANTGNVANGYLNLTYTINKKWKLSTWGNIGSPRINLQGRNSPWWNYQFSFNRSFLKDHALRLGLNMDNAFHKERVWVNTVNDPAFTTISNSYQPARAIRLSVNYRFGKLKENVSRKKGVKNDDQKSGGGQG
jgi:outer membrane receptor protein involved in Fe transport